MFLRDLLAKIVMSEHGGGPKLPFMTPGDSNATAADLALARQAAEGDPAATTRLLKLVAPAILRAVRVVLGPRHPDVEDIFQQSLIALVQALPTFRGDCHPAGYASRIGVHNALTSRRRDRTARAHLSELAAIALVQEQPIGFAGSAGRAAQRRHVMRALLEELPSEQAETLAMHVMVGYSLEEVAEATSTPLNTVKSRLRLAKGALRRTIEANPHLAKELEVDS